MENDTINTGTVKKSKYDEFKSLLEKTFNNLKPLLMLILNNSSIIFTWLVAVGITIAFKSKISKFISEYSLLKEEDLDDTLRWIFLIFSIGIIIRFLYLGLKNYRLSTKLNFILFYLSVVYLFLRNDEKDNLWFSSFISSIYYMDLLLLTALLSIILYLRNAFLPNYKLYDKLNMIITQINIPVESHSDSYLIEDIPLEGDNENENDILIDEIILAIAGLKPEQPFIIGINSIWGMGKTSFLQRLERKIKNRENESNQASSIIFWFNAWQHQEDKLILSNFFNQLKKELSKYSGNAKSSIEIYLNQLIQLVDNKALNLINSSVNNFFSGAETVKESYQEINNIIEDIDRKIIVFVDDIDRLNKNEILETLRLLRNVAGFQNIIFICGLDREYVVSKSEIDNHFLDKIFNLELRLIKHSHKNYLDVLNKLIDNLDYLNDDKDLLKESLSKIFKEDDFQSWGADLILDDSNHIKPEEQEYISLTPAMFFESHRDIKRFFNELIIHINTLKKIADIDIDDYILFKLLLFKYKWVYELFLNKKVSLWLGAASSLTLNEKEFIAQLPKINNLDRKILVNILRILFPNYSVIKNFNSINQKRYFPIYLNNNIYSESFSFSELQQAVSQIKIEELINKKIIKRDEKNLLINDVKDYLLKEENIKSEEEFVQVIKLIKGNYFGYVGIEEILDLVYLGEIKYYQTYNDILEKEIFTNLSDDFAVFMNELNKYYSTLPKETSYSDIKNFESPENAKKISEFKILTRTRLLQILLKLAGDEVSSQKDIQKVFSVGYFFSEYRYRMFNFMLLYKDFSEIMKNYFNNNFADMFLSTSPRDILVNLNPRYIANIFEDEDERKNIIERTEEIHSRHMISSTDLDSDIRKYVVKGMDNFVEFVNQLEQDIAPEFEQKFVAFKGWLNTYKSNNYFLVPTDEEVERYRMTYQTNH